MQFVVNNEFGYIPSSVFHTQTLLNPVSDLFLFELVYHQPRTQFRFEPGSLRRHNVSCIGNIHQLLHRNRIKCQSHFHFAAVNPSAQFAQAADSPTKSIRRSERRSLIPRISSRIRLEEMVTSNTPIGSLSS